VKDSVLLSWHVLAKWRERFEFHFLYAFLMLSMVFGLIQGPISPASVLLPAVFAAFVLTLPLLVRAFRTVVAFAKVIK
jgi:hypothetical protein